MNDKTAQQLLREAADLVERADALLDTSEARCGECRQRHFANFNHGKVHRSIENIPAKLREQADWLDAGTHEQQQASARR